ncbi:TetR/AcrR family transcriptional regulator [Paeniglutamicibacter sp. ORCA_105]|uniref:TetR/AcrR family transcriptional regulator n=1 Tax=Paeniglutamicibacter sp. ORCA_105 TaxID=3377336 RepID=UPI0038961AF3
MKSQRTTGPGDEKLLLATRESVVLHGVRRTTANDIAERAGISRMTFYRRMGSVENAVLATLTREFRTAAAGVRSASPAGTGREQLVHFAIQSVRVFATSELLDSIAERDPEFLIPYVTDRFGASQQLILDQLDALIAAGQADHSIEATAATATTLLLVLQGVALSARLLRKTGAFEDSLGELERMLLRHLAPQPEATR